MAFMIAAMVAAVIVSASITSTKRIYDDQVRTQLDLTVESAVRVVRAELLKTRDEGNEAVIKEVSTENPDGSVTDEKTYTYSGNLETEIKAALEYVYENDQAYTGSFVVSASAPDGALKDVNVDYKLNYMDFDGKNEFTLYMTFSADDSNKRSSDDIHSEVSLTLKADSTPAEERTHTSADGKVITTEIKISWRS